MINASQLRIGTAIKYEGQHYRVVAAEYHPGQNLTTGTFWEHSFRSDLKLEEMPVERHSFEFLSYSRMSSK